MTASAQALNHEIIDDLRAILGEDFHEIVSEQIEQAEIYLQELGTTLANGDNDKAMRCAHSLKSSVGQIGLQGIHALAKELEYMCNSDVGRKTANAHALELHRLLIDEFPGAVRSLQTYAEKPVSTTSPQMH